MPGAKLWRLSMLIIVAGCSTQPKVAKEGPDVVCHQEQTIGSLITRSVCTTRAERAEQAAQLEELRRVAAGAAGASGHPTAGPSVQ
jgi:hypothetical protein